MASVMLAAAVSCGTSNPQPPIDLGGDDLGDNGPVTVADATLGPDTSMSTPSSPAPSTDASNDAGADSPLPLDAGPDVFGPGVCEIVGTAPSSCAPARVTCTGQIFRPIAPARQSKCYIAWIDEFYAACLDGDPSACATFRASSAAYGPDSGIEQCLSCLMTSPDAGTWGPLVAAANGMLTPNLGGCFHSPDSFYSCASVQLTFDECKRVACAAGCGGDPADPVAEAAFQACEDAAGADPNVCAPYAPPSSLCGIESDMACFEGYDFATRAYSTMMDFCATNWECQPSESTQNGVVATQGLALPQPLHQNVCSPSQIQGFLEACDRDVDDASTGTTCDDFLAANGACGTCLQSDVDAGAYGALVNDPLTNSWFINSPGCVYAALGPDAGAPCTTALWRNLACAYDECTGNLSADVSCSTAIFPFDECNVAADQSSCALTVAPANDCVAALRDAGGDPATCVANYATLEDAVVALTTLFCGP